MLTREPFICVAVAARTKNDALQRAKKLIFIKNILHIAEKFQLIPSARYGCG